MIAVRNIRKIWGVARTEYLNWITNPRIIILGVLLIFIKALCIDTLSERAGKFGDTMIIFEPYIAVGNSSVLSMFTPLVFLILLSDYPRLGGNALFYISRTGKKNWLCGQIIFLIMAIITFETAILAASMLLSGGHFDTEWSEAVRKYLARFPEEIKSFDSNLLPSNLYNQIPMIRALWQTLVFQLMNLLVLALIIYFMKILFSSAAGLVGALLVMGLGAATVSSYSPIRWAFPMANTILWMHYTDFLKKPIYPMWASFLYFGILLTALIAANFFALKKMNILEGNQSD